MEIKTEKTVHKLFGRTNRYTAPSLLSFHWHENYEICHIRKNRCQFLIDGTMVKANEGDLVVIPKNIVHQFRITEDTAIRIIQIHPTVFIQSGIRAKSLKKHISKKEIQEIPGLEQKLASLLEWMESETPVKKEEDDNPVLQHIALTLYSLLMRHFFSEEAYPVSDKNRDDFYKAIEYINLHYTENINIRVIAEKLYISREKLSAIFKKYSGISLNDYIYQLRLKKANLLLEGGSKIIEAALESGFQNIRTFNNIYKKQFGFSPSEYLNQIKKPFGTR